jgi:hypothetical protein
MLVAKRRAFTKEILCGGKSHGMQQMSPSLMERF